MKRFTAAGTIALASFSFAISAHAGEVLDRVLATKTLKVETAAAFPPASFMNDKGQNLADRTTARSAFSWDFFRLKANSRCRGARLQEWAVALAVIDERLPGAPEA
ncbi:hypothetical protein NXT3_PB00269 (plasmid) [Sinorhizobium fredii]|uniref:Uncharacterized protein n=1 Tax=Rhizobium fredii TaxID=380 RepID=A0A2L0HBZ8_RHIFR|nr:hypothetical protein NXT3_PB00269 [Sinorhizobium fredii]